MVVFDMASLSIIENALRTQPTNPEALALKADIFEHQGKHRQAESLAQTVLASDATYLDAGWVLGPVVTMKANFCVHTRLGHIHERDKVSANRIRERCDVKRKQFTATNWNVQRIGERHKAPCVHVVTLIAGLVIPG